MSNRPVDSFRRVATRLVGAGRKGVGGGGGGRQLLPVLDQRDEHDAATDDGETDQGGADEDVLGEGFVPAGRGDETHLFTSLC